MVAFCLAMCYVPSSRAVPRPHGHVNPKQDSSNRALAAPALRRTSREHTTLARSSPARATARASAITSSPTRCGTVPWPRRTASLRSREHDLYGFGLGGVAAWRRPLVCPESARSPVIACVRPLPHATRRLPLSWSLAIWGSARSPDKVVTGRCLPLYPTADHGRQDVGRLLALLPRYRNSFRLGQHRTQHPPPRLPFIRCRGSRSPSDRGTIIPTQGPPLSFDSVRHSKTVARQCRRSSTSSASTATSLVPGTGSGPGRQGWAARDSNPEPAD